MTDIGDMMPEEIEKYLADIGVEKYRARQIFRWIYKGAESFDEMTDLSKDLREKLKGKALLRKCRAVKIQKSKKDGTRKYLVAMEDGNTVESVFMKYDYGNSVCVSSQAGCSMGCKFCASGLWGLKRDLTPGEMVGQVLMACRDTGEKVNHIVVMGTGEPFCNYENVRKFIRLINHKDGLCIGMRNITVSTCGIVPVIRQFAKDMPQTNLAVSLHGPDDVTRNKLMPINKKYNVDLLLETTKEYSEATGRRVTYEYALIKGINDEKNHAEVLCGKLAKTLSHVNLIPLNRVYETGYEGSDRKRVEVFRKILERGGVNVTVRRSLGSDIDAACGQLRPGEK